MNVKSVQVKMQERKQSRNGFLLIRIKEYLKRKKWRKMKS